MRSVTPTSIFSLFARQPFPLFSLRSGVYSLTVGSQFFYRLTPAGLRQNVSITVRRREPLFATPPPLGSLPCNLSFALHRFHSSRDSIGRRKEVSSETIVDNSPGQEVDDALEISRIYLAVGLRDIQSIPRDSSKLGNILYGILIFNSWFVWNLGSFSRHVALLLPLA